MRAHSLSRALARRFMAFTAALCILFVAATLLLLFVLEDSFIDRRLRAVATTISDASAPPASLPERFQVIDWTALPEDIRSRMQHRRVGRIAEFRRTGGRYVHVMAAQTDAGQPFALVYDVTDELTVNSGMHRGLAYASGMLVILLLGAYALARLFVAGTTRRAATLIQQIKTSQDPDSLDVLAAQQPVTEFADLLRLHSAIWREQLVAVERAHETLAYLGHELRTPLQSACTSLALLEQQPDHTQAWARLRRAIHRLTRASNAILWLSTDTLEASRERSSALDCVTGLVQELRPLAEARGQNIIIAVSPCLHWSAPSEVIETLLANLLINAIQHGGAGTITIDADADTLAVRNPLASVDAQGFGMGLDIANRLAARIGWQLDFGRHDERICVTLHWPEVA